MKDSLPLKEKILEMMDTRYDVILLSHIWRWEVKSTVSAEPISPKASLPGVDTRSFQCSQRYLIFYMSYFFPFLRISIKLNWDSYFNVTNHSKSTL